MAARSLCRAAAPCRRLGRRPRICPYPRSLSRLQFRLIPLQRNHVAAWHRLLANSAAPRRGLLHGVSLPAARNVVTSEPCLTVGLALPLGNDPLGLTCCSQGGRKVVADQGSPVPSRLALSPRLHCIRISL